MSDESWMVPFIHGTPLHDEMSEVFRDHLALVSMVEVCNFTLEQLRELIEQMALAAPKMEEGEMIPMSDSTMRMFGFLLKVQGVTRFYLVLHPKPVLKASLEYE